MKLIPAFVAITLIAAPTFAEPDTNAVDKGPIFSAFEQVELTATQARLRNADVTAVQLRQVYTAAELCRVLGGREVFDAAIFDPSTQSSTRRLAAAIAFNADLRQGRTPSQIYAARDLPLGR